MHADVFLCAVAPSRPSTCWAAVSVARPTCFDASKPVDQPRSSGEEVCIPTLSLSCVFIKKVQRILKTIQLS